MPMCWANLCWRRSRLALWAVCLVWGWRLGWSCSSVPSQGLPRRSHGMLSLWRWALRQRSALGLACTRLAALHCCSRSRPCGMSSERELMRFFLVVIHDVAPPFLEDIRGIIRQLRPLIGSDLAAGFVPCWYGQSVVVGADAHRESSQSSMHCRERDFITLVRAAFGEILLHGWTHYRCQGGLISLLTSGADEFAALPPDAALARLCAGQRVVYALFGAPAAGFIPPAWQSGGVAHALCSGGLSYRMGWMSIDTVWGARIPLVTWSWDLGRMACLGYAGDLLGVACSLLRYDTIPCVVFHPSDVRRGYLGHGVYLVRKLLAEGRRPILPMQLIRRYS